MLSYDSFGTWKKKWKRMVHTESENVKSQTPYEDEAVGKNGELSVRVCLHLGSKSTWLCLERYHELCTKH